MNRKNILLSLFMICICLAFISCGPEQSAQESMGKTTSGKNQSTENTDVKTTRGTPVEAITVKAESVEQSIPSIGIIKPLHSVDIVAEVSGKVEKINKELGEGVAVEEILAIVDDKIPLGQYRQAKSQVLSAETNLKITRLNLKSDKDLLESGDISMLAYENSSLVVKTAEANHLSALANLSLLEKTYMDTRIKSPISGFISRKYIDIGTMVTPGSPVYRVVDLTTLKIEIGVPQAIITRIKMGSSAKIVISAMGNQTFDGHVRFISPQADEGSGTFAVEIHVANTKELDIRAGMTAKLDLLISNNEGQIVIPDHALVKKKGLHYVYKITDDVARLTQISVAGIIGSYVMVKDGLSEGDTIVVVGMKNLGVETKVNIETVN